MKITTSLQLVTFAAGLALSSAFAQTSPAPALAAEDGGGLLGATYSGVEFGYTHHVESAPRALRRYGFVSHKPMAELGATVDGTFRYDYVRGSLPGATLHQNHLSASLLRYWVDGSAKPFVHADVGWAWHKAGGASDSSFLYRLGAGAEVWVRPRVAVTPFVMFSDTPDLDDRVWNFGAKFGYRLDRHWHAGFTLKLDSEHNIEYALGFQRRF